MDAREGGVPGAGKSWPTGFRSPEFWRSREFPLFVSGPAGEAACGVSGFILANHHDLPPAQGVVLLLSLAWLASLLFRRLRG